jgi:aminobenzoyl-glutamate utilization protein B
MNYASHVTIKRLFGRYVRTLVVTVFAVSLCSPLLAQSREKRTAMSQTDALWSEIQEMSKTLWEYSELAMLEYRSAEYLTGVLENAGFEVERGAADMPTAFIATYGSGAPIIGILAEYDALPGNGNSIVPARVEREDGNPDGQGCGHNLFGAASIGAAIALKRTMEEHDLSGTIRLYGTPAEETVVGKVYMAKAGVFDDLDAAIEWHPGLEIGVNNQPGMAMNNFTVEFFGQSAHSAADPWNGRSALDAVEMLNYGANMMREHVLPTTRIHYVMPSAGEAPNVVPDYAKVWYYVRATNRDEVEEYYNWILKIAEGAAMATRTTHEVFLTTGVHEMLLNRPLQEAMQENLELVGAPEFAPEDQAFARELQKFIGIDEVGLVQEIKPLASGAEPVSGGSTDVAEVSHITPTVGFSMTTAAAGIPWHSWAATASHGTDGSVRATVAAAKVIALMGVDMLTDASLLERAKAFSLEKTGGSPYQSPIPVNQAPPVKARP